MYASFAELWEGLTKNAFAAHRYSVVRSLVLVFGIWFTTLFPLVVLVRSLLELTAAASQRSSDVEVLFVLSAAQVLLSAALHFPMIAFCRIAWGYALLAPLGSLLYTVIVLDSLLRTLVGKGVTWKLRRYGKPSWEAEK
jgi:hypothetical protein